MRSFLLGSLRSSQLSSVCGAGEKLSAALCCRLWILQAAHSDVSALVLQLREAAVLLRHIYTPPVHSQGRSLQMPHLV